MPSLDEKLLEARRASWSDRARVPRYRAVALESAGGVAAARLTRNGEGQADTAPRDGYDRYDRQMIDRRGLSQAEMAAIFEAAERNGLTDRPVDLDMQAAAGMSDSEAESGGNLAQSGRSLEAPPLPDDATKFDAAPEDRAQALAFMDFEILPYVFEGKFATAAAEWLTTLKSPDDSVVKAAALKAVRARIDGQKLTELCVAASEAFFVKNGFIGPATKSTYGKCANSPSRANFDTRILQRLLKLSRIADLVQIVGWGPTDALRRFSLVRLIVTGWEEPAGVDEGNGGPSESRLADRTGVGQGVHLHQADSPLGYAGPGLSAGPERRERVPILEPSNPSFERQEGTPEDDLASFLLS